MSETSSVFCPEAAGVLFTDEPDARSYLKHANRLWDARFAAPFMAASRDLSIGKSRIEELKESLRDRPLIEVVRSEELAILAESLRAYEKRVADICNNWLEMYGMLRVVRKSAWSDSAPVLFSVAWFEALHGAQICAGSYMPSEWLGKCVESVRYAAQSKRTTGELRAMYMRKTAGRSRYSRTYFFELREVERQPDFKGRKQLSPSLEQYHDGFPLEDIVWSECLVPDGFEMPSIRHRPGLFWETETKK